MPTNKKVVPLMKMFGMARTGAKPARAGMSPLKKRVTAGVASLFLVGGALTGATLVAAPANAATVENMMLCEPDTGWCFQTNPPYNPAFDHMCTWDFKLNGNGLESGMYYTGCTAGLWQPAIH